MSTSLFFTYLTILTFSHRHELEMSAKENILALGITNTSEPRAVPSDGVTQQLHLATALEIG